MYLASHTLQILPFSPYPAMNNFCRLKSLTQSLHTESPQKWHQSVKENLILYWRHWLQNVGFDITEFADAELALELPAKRATCLHLRASLKIGSELKFKGNFCLDPLNEKKTLSNFAAPC